MFKFNMPLFALVQFVPPLTVLKMPAPAVAA
jgi:hypothetical protein